MHPIVEQPEGELLWNAEITAVIRKLRGATSGSAAGSHMNRPRAQPNMRPDRVIAPPRRQEVPRDAVHHHEREGRVVPTFFEFGLRVSFERCHLGPRGGV